jgi:hypothetical protein
MLFEPSAKACRGLYSPVCPLSLASPETCNSISRINSTEINCRYTAHINLVESHKSRKRKVFMTLLFIRQRCAVRYWSAENQKNLFLNYFRTHRLCGLVVRVLGYRSRGPGWIPGTSRKKSSGSVTGFTQPREYN